MDLSSTVQEDKMISRIEKIEKRSIQLEKSEFNNMLSRWWYKRHATIAGKLNIFLADEKTYIHDVLIQIHRDYSQEHPEELGTIHE